MKAAYRGASPRALPGGECQSSSGRRCSICHAVDLEYGAEALLHNQALQAFWKSLQQPVPLQPLVLSPRGRGYRTVTRRRVFHRGPKVSLGLVLGEDAGSPPVPFVPVRCAIEPPEHGRVYARATDLLIRPAHQPLVRALSYVVVKGSYQELTVILNVSRLDHDVVQAANAFSKSLSKGGESIVGLFLYEDPAPGKYYLGSRHPQRRPSVRKIFGKTDIYQRIQGRSFLFSPLAFSQTNLSIVELLVEKAADLLLPSSASRLYDLYCGWGLFSLCLSARAGSVVGLEVSPAAVESARANATRQKAVNVRFRQADIQADAVSHILAGAGPSDRVLLDPPRSGTAPGVLEAIAAVRPGRVLHLFCNADLIGPELSRWAAASYRPATAVPFDMFPGTDSIEIMVLLEPAA